MGSHYLAVPLSWVRYSRSSLAAWNRPYCFLGLAHSSNRATSWPSLAMCGGGS